jgi:hypothetical protein
MPKGKWRRFAAPAIIAAAATLVIAASATAATTYRVSGEQIPVDVDAGLYKMRGGLIGDWAFTSFSELATSPIYRAKGTEQFSGCLDVKLDGKCKGDPSGTLRFRFRYWAKFDEQGGLVWGTCMHPVTGGTGAFAGATGVLAMVDTQTAQGVQTAYVGHVTLRGATGSRARASAASRVC